jgi:hypothetical protein
VSELATWIPAVLERIAAVPLVGAAGIAEKAATDAAVQVAKAAVERASTPSTLERLPVHVNVGHGKLSGNLPAGWQAHHLNQNRAHGDNIARNEGISVPMRGNIFTEPGTPHYIFHRSLEQFWDQYRRGSLIYSMPTNAEYGEAVRRAFIESGLSADEASDLAAQGAAQRIAAGLSESAKVPRIPGPIWRQLMHPRTIETLDRLEKASWFSRVGINEGAGVTVVTSWQQAIRHCDSDEWEDLELEVLNQYREFIAYHSTERLERYCG